VTDTYPDIAGRNPAIKVFRRPGREMCVEPGLTFVRGRSTWAASVPIAFYRNRHPDPHGGTRRRDVPEFRRARRRLGAAREIGGGQRGARRAHPRGSSWAKPSG
jgi:hypothetical protein